MRLKHTSVSASLPLTLRINFSWAPPTWAHLLKIWLPITPLCLLRTKEHPHVLAETAVYSPLIRSQMLTNQKETQEEWKGVKT